MDTEEEARYRLAVAGDFLQRAKEQLDSWRQRREGFFLAGAVGDAQACVETAAKAVIACTRVPSRRHDPSEELVEMLREARGKLPASRVRAVKRLATLARHTAPEHVRAIYGDETRRIPLSELYAAPTARRMVRAADKAYRSVKAFVDFWFRQAASKRRRV